MTIIQNGVGSFSIIANSMKPNVVFATLYTREDAELVLRLLNNQSNLVPLNESTVREIIFNHSDLSGAVHYSNAAKEICSIFGASRKELKQ